MGTMTRGRGSLRPLHHDEAGEKFNQ
jgi:hypothetical protein